MRGPVPRDRCLARDRPSPYEKEGLFWKGGPVLNVVRGPVPRKFGMARDRPSPYGKVAPFRK